MDEYSGKRAISGLAVPRKGSRLVLRETADNRDRNAQFCNRLGCSGRLNYTKGTQIGCSEKPKSLRSSFHSSSGKEIVESSSRTCPMVTNARKSFHDSRKKLSSKLETDSSEISSVQDDSEVPELIASPRRIETGCQSELRDAESSKVTLREVGSSMTTSARPRKIFHKKSGLGNHDTLPFSSGSSASEGTGQGTRGFANASRYSLRNLKCNSISDVLPQGCSSSESNTSRRKDMVKKRNPEGESSSSFRGKKMSGPSSDDGRISLPTSGISICDSRRARNWPPGRESGVTSVRTRKSTNGNMRMGHSNQVNGNNSSLTESPAVISQLPQLPINGNIPSSLHQVYAEASSSRPSSYNHPNISGNLPTIMPISPGELGINRLASRDGSRRYNIDGIAEVLLMLERIEQDEELTYEQLLELETNLFLGGLNFYDQHRDMRLDIDNMSYEELLALEEKMGTVSTAVSEEALSKCLKRSIYVPSPPEEQAMECSGDVNDIKCSICQEEYVVGDEVGRLGCEHGYHMVCVNQWLRLKNWCPICKASVAPSQSTSLS